MAGRLNRGDIHLSHFAPPDKERLVITSTIPLNLLGRRVAGLSADRMREVCAALRFALGCD